MGLEHQLVRNDGDEITLQALDPATLSPNEIEEYLGRYRSDELGATYQLVLDGESLFMRHENPHRNYFVNELLPIAKDRFRATPASFTFKRNHRGEITAALVDDRHYIWSLVFAREPD
jgi:hypothetical protein